MKYFDWSEDLKKMLFCREGESIRRNGSKEELEYSLGALLYMPGIKSKAFDMILENKDIKSCVFCLEDSIKDNEVEQAEQNLKQGIKNLNKKVKEQEISLEDLPLIFVRIRNPLHMRKVSNILGEDIGIVNGFIMPKLDSKNAKNEDKTGYMDILEEINHTNATVHNNNNFIFGMPILESRSLVLKYQRSKELYKLHNLFNEYKEYILNIRVGGTDLSGVCGIRRPVDLSIYDIITVKDIFSDIISTFCNNKDRFVVSGPVWEYYKKETKEIEGINDKFSIDVNTEGLLKETFMDKHNGFTGKTCIHPSQLLPVQLSYCVGFNEYQDALAILGATDGGVTSSLSQRMNEAKPHTYWAEKIIKRARIYGVLNQADNDVTIVKELLKTEFIQRSTK